MGPCSSRAGTRTRKRRLTAGRDAISPPWNGEPRDGVDPSRPRYKDGFAAGRRSLLSWFGTEVSILVRAGSEPGELAAASRSNDRLRSGTGCRAPLAGFKGPPPRRRHPIITLYRARRGSRTRLMQFGGLLPLPLGQTRVGALGRNRTYVTPGKSRVDEPAIGRGRPWRSMEPRDGVDPSKLRYECSSGAGRQGEVVPPLGLEPRSHGVRARSIGIIGRRRMPARRKAARRRTSTRSTLQLSENPHGGAAGTRTQLCRSRRFYRPARCPYRQRPRRCYSASGGTRLSRGREAALGNPLLQRWQRRVQPVTPHPHSIQSTHLSRLPKGVFAPSDTRLPSLAQGDYALDAPIPFAPETFSPRMAGRRGIEPRTV